MTTKTKAGARLRREIEHYDAVAGQSAPAGAAGVQKNRARAVVFSLRLNPEDITELERIAAELDIPATVLARGFVLQGMAEHRDSDPAQMIDRIQTELGVVSGMLARRGRKTGRAG